MATPSKRPVPEGMHTVTPYLWFNGNAMEAIEFYQKALGAKVWGEPVMDGDRVMHALVRIGDSPVMLSDTPVGGYEQGPDGTTTVTQFLYVEDADELFTRAVRAGAEIRMPLLDQFWGDRMGSVQDPFGHVWMIATHKFDPTPEEMRKAQEEMKKTTQK